MDFPFGGKKDDKAGDADNKKADTKTTSDEGKTFDKDTVFVCVQDCYQNGTRYRKGDEVTGKKCLPYFVVKPAEDKK